MDEKWKQFKPSVPKSKIDFFDFILVMQNKTYYNFEYSWNKKRISQINVCIVMVKKYSQSTVNKKNTQYLKIETTQR